MTAAVTAARRDAGQRAATALAAGCVLLASVVAHADPPSAESSPSSHPNATAASSSCAADPPGIVGILLGRINDNVAPAPTGIGFFLVNGTPPSPGVDETAPVAITLSLARAIVAGRPMRPTLRVHNRGPRRIRVLGALDGSLEHMREPLVDVYLRDEATQRVYRFGFQGLRCGLTNRIREGDYAVVEPARMTRLGAEWVAFDQMRFPRTGRYTVWASYRFCGFPREAPDPSIDPGERDIVHRSALVGVFVSSPVTFVVP